MGCCQTSLNRIGNHSSFETKDILPLVRIWPLLKGKQPIKFTDDVLIRSMHQSEVLRHFWTSKFVIDGNNYDFSQGDSCVRTNTSWLVGIREYSVHLSSTFDRLLLVINDEHLLLNEIRTLPLLQMMSTLDQASLLLIKQTIIEVMIDYLQRLKTELTTEDRQAWDKFLLFIIERLSNRHPVRLIPTEIIVSPATAIERTSTNALN